jgi:hypothetical protein
MCVRAVLAVTPFITQATNASQLAPLLQYDMTMDDCQMSTFFNGGIFGKDSMILIRNASTTACTLGFGVESNFSNGTYTSDEMKLSNAVYASKPIGSFVENLSDDTIPVINESGLTISLWIRPIYVHEHNCNDGDKCKELTPSRSIFTIGWDTFGTNTVPPTGLTLCEKSKIDFQLSIVQTNLLEIVYRTSDQIFEPCQRINVDISSLLRTDVETQLSSRPMHIAISLGNYHQEVFVNGKTLARKREAFDADLKHWNPMSLISFFTYPSTEYHPLTPWEGQLFRFAVHSGILNKNQVRSLMSEGLSPSQPVAYPKLVHINEDALDQNGTLQQIRMPYSFLDYEIASLLNDFGLSHQPAAFVRHYITRFPTKGHIFHIEDGRIIEPSGNLPVLVSNTDRLVYMPRKDEHSEFLGGTYTSFDYCVTTNKIIMSSQCTPATISVVVDPVNDPPMAIIPPLYIVYEGVKNEASALLLTGSDVDKNDFIQNIEITSPPKMGYIFLSVSSFREEDKLLHGTILSESNNTIPGKEVYIEYRFTDYNTTTIQDSLVMDFFRFRVQDSAGSWSSEAEAKIQVLSSVTSSTDNPNKWRLQMAEAGGVSNQLTGIDSSGFNRTLGFLIKSLPSKVVILDDEGAPLEENQIIESSTSSLNGEKNIESASVTFVGIRSACNRSDNLLINDRLNYQVVALGADKEVLSISLAKEEEITIICGVAPVSMHFIDGEEPMSVSAFVSPTDDNCSGYMFDFTEDSRKACRDTALLFGLEVDNAKKLSWPVYVVITTSPSGFLSLNQNYLSDVQTFFDQPVMRSSIRFVVPAEKLHDVLSAIHFQSDSFGRDKIQVVLQYGRCNHNETFLVDHEFSVSTEECYKTQKNIYVNVQQNPQGFETSSHYPFPWVPLFVIAVLGPIFYMKGKAKQTVEEIHLEWKEEGGTDDLPEVIS